MQYNDMFNILVDLLGTPRENEASLKAMLRHFYVMGVPNIERVGTGKRHDYSFEDFREMYIAMTMSHMGLFPYKIVKILKAIRDFDNSPYPVWERHAVIRHKESVALFTDEQLSDMLSKWAGSISFNLAVINTRASMYKDLFS